MLENVQTLALEIGPICNMAKAHPWCPSGHPDRYRAHASSPPASRYDRLRFIQSCFRAGFHGHLAFHLYNEPMLEYEAVVELARIAKTITGIPSVIWTNGTDYDKIDRALFRVVRTDYSGTGGDDATPYEHDDRIEIYRQPLCPRPAPCYRPAEIELPVDYYGDVHLCCADWRGTVFVGNIKHDNHEDIIAEFARCAERAKEGSFDLCCQCQSLERSPMVCNSGFRLWD